MIAESASEGKLAVVNQAGGRCFAVCHSCGFTMLAGEKAPSPHTTPWGRECRGTLKNTHLGHEYLTDILHLSFEGTTQRDPDFWLSLLYGLLEGMSLALEIDRQDLDGCLYPYSGDPRLPALILFDNVPGGAGHVHRLAADPDLLRRTINATIDRLEQCICGGELGNTSCYGCLRSYANQFYHDRLKRGPVITFLKSMVGADLSVMQVDV